MTSAPVRRYRGTVERLVGVEAFAYVRVPPRGRSVCLDRLDCPNGELPGDGSLVEFEFGPHSGRLRHVRVMVDASSDRRNGGWALMAGRCR